MGYRQGKSLGIGQRRQESAFPDSYSASVGGVDVESGAEKNRFRGIASAFADYSRGKAATGGASRTSRRRYQRRKRSCLGKDTRRVESGCVATSSRNGSQRDGRRNGIHYHCHKLIKQTNKRKKGKKEFIHPLLRKKKN